MTVKLINYDYSCTDGCCTDYGTKVLVDDVELGAVSWHDTSTILEMVLKHLGHQITVEEVDETN